MLLLSKTLPIPHGFSTRAGGVSAPPYDSLNLGRTVGDRPESVEENARRLAGTLDVSPGQLMTVDQVHGEVLLEAPEARPGAVQPRALGEADGLFTRAPLTALCIRTADCVPVLLYAPDVPAVAAVHAGWRGALQGIPGAGVKILRDRYGADPKRILAVVGPSIRRCCYRVGSDVALRFRERYGAAVLSEGDRLDLPAVCVASLAAAGVPESQVEITPHCTCCEADRFFSHRRDQGRTGRHMSVVMLPAPAR